MYGRIGIVLAPVIANVDTFIPMSLPCRYICACVTRLMAVLFEGMRLPHAILMELSLPYPGTLRNTPSSWGLDLLSAIVDWAARST